MADEIRLRAQLSFAKSGKSAHADSGEISATMAGGDYFQGNQTVGTSEEALLIGDISVANSFYMIENLHATNRVDLKPAAGGTVTTQIAAGRCAVGQFGPLVTAPFVIAITTAVEIKITLIEA